MTTILRIFKSDLFKNSLIYLIGAGFLKGVSFFLIPIFTARLSPIEYGQLELINNFSSTVSTVLSFGLGQVLFIEYFHLEKSERKVLVKDIVQIYCLVASPLFLILFFIVILNIKMYFGDGITIPWVQVILFTTYLMFFQSLFYSVLKISQKAFNVTLNQVIVGVVTFFTNIFFVVYLKKQVVGIIEANVIVMVLSLLYPLYTYKKEVGLSWIKVKNKKIIEYLKIGFPFVPGALAASVIMGLDRWILLNYSNQYEVGIYSIAYKFASISQILIVLPLLDSYMPYTFKKFSIDNYDQKIRFLFPLVIVMSFFIGYAIQYTAAYFVNRSYFPGLPIIPYLVIGIGFYFLSQIAVYPILFNKRTNIAVVTTVLGAVVSVSFNLIFIPKYAAKGAAFSFVLSYIILFIMNYLISQRVITRNRAQKRLK